MPAVRNDTLTFTDLGRIGYAEALAVQTDLHARVLAGACPATVLLLEHEPVITVTPRASGSGHLIASPAALERDGVEVVETDRGGDVTYHGPGQLVAYPIVPLQRYGLNVRQYVAALEDVIIDTLASFGIAGRRDEAGIGVWVERAKIAAIGVRIRRWVSLHGLAINVTTNLDHFRHIVPCGLQRPVTSLRALLGPACPEMPAVSDSLAEAFSNRFERGRVTREG